MLIFLGTLAALMGVGPPIGVLYAPLAAAKVVAAGR
jgi:hypothetical protein